MGRQSKKEGSGFTRALTPFMLWGLGVGYVISGMYFGWNLGLEKGGTLGMAVATVFIMILYLTFTFSYAELACAIPRAGGGFDYTRRALGRDAGFITGVAQMVEFIFAPPAIAFAIGAYFNAFFPQIPVIASAITAYLLFTALNIYGIRAAATFETVVTLLALAELLLFASLTLPHFQFSHLSRNPLPNGWGGMFAAIPFAIWFFLGIEGVANVAEESRNPQKDISRGFGWAIFTLIGLSILVFLSATGVGGWERIVYQNGVGGETSDSPLPLALGMITGSGHLMYHILITVGLFGLVASFHGLILASGRSTYEMGKVGQAPAFLGQISGLFHTPANALVVNMVIGILALLSGKTSEIITLSVFGALTLYSFSMISILVLRRKQPGLPRPFRVPLYPLFPLLALLISVVSLVAMMIYQFRLGIIYFSILLGAYLLFRIFQPIKKL